MKEAMENVKTNSKPNWHSDYIVSTFQLPAISAYFIEFVVVVVVYFSLFSSVSYSCQYDKVSYPMILLIKWNIRL